MDKKSHIIAGILILLFVLYIAGLNWLYILMVNF